MKWICEISLNYYMLLFGNGNINNKGTAAQVYFILSELNLMFSMSSENIGNAHTFKSLIMICLKREEIARMGITDMNTGDTFPQSMTSMTAYLG